MTESRVVVTGHTRGLGEAITRHLLDRQVAVLGIARTENGVLNRYGEALQQVRLDLSNDRDLVDWLGSGALAQFFEGASLAMLVNNAGLLQPVGPLETQDPALVARAAAVNVSAVLTLSAGFVAATGHSGERRILHVSSGAGRKAYAGWSVYCAGKAALDHHARAVALDRTPGLRIASVAPGVIDTDMQAEIRAAPEGLFPDRQRFVELKREGRLLSPDDAGRAVADFLLSSRFGKEPVTDLRHG